MAIGQSDNSLSKEEVDLLALVKSVWNHRKTIFIIISIFVCFGVFIALMTPNEFSASSIFVPQTAESNKSVGSLGGLASIAGINLSGTGAGTEIPLSLYPKIVSSVTFKKALLDVQLHVEGVETPVTYSNYFDKIYTPGVLGLITKYTLGLPGLALQALKGEAEASVVQTPQGLIRISEKDSQHFKRLEKQLSITPNEKEGFVTLSFTLPEPMMAAQMAQFSQELLQNEVIAFKISNAREQLKFTEARFVEKKDEFEQIQARLSNFRERNQNIASAAMQNQLQRLEAEYNFAFGIYTELAKQLEQAKLQVAKDTPIFSVIQPATIPSEKSAPNRSIILIVFVVLGVIVGVGFVVGVELLHVVKDKWHTKEKDLNKDLI
nr:exopolysaccharide biosynthesis protein [Cytophagales bacterium]